MLVPIIEGIFMVELKKNILPQRIDETNVYIKLDSADYAFLDLFHSNIKEYNNKISFLDVLIFWNNSKTQTAVHQKPTFICTGIYLR